jgi:hypothetical protein
MRSTFRGTFFSRMARCSAPLREAPDGLARAGAIGGVTPAATP